MNALRKILLKLCIVTLSACLLIDQVKATEWPPTVSRYCVSSPSTLNRILFFESQALSEIGLSAKRDLSLQHHVTLEGLRRTYSVYPNTLEKFSKKLNAIFETDGMGIASYGGSTSIEQLFCRVLLFFEQVDFLVDLISDGTMVLQEKIYWPLVFSELRLFSKKEKNGGRTTVRAGVLLNSFGCSLTKRLGNHMGFSGHAFNQLLPIALSIAQRPSILTWDQREALIDQLKSLESWETLKESVRPPVVSLTIKSVNREARFIPAQMQDLDVTLDLSILYRRIRELIYALPNGDQRLLNGFLELENGVRVPLDRLCHVVGLTTVNGVWLRVRKLLRSLHRPILELVEQSQLLSQIRFSPSTIRDLLWNNESRKWDYGPVSHLLQLAFDHKPEPPDYLSRTA